VNSRICPLAVDDSTINIVVVIIIIIIIIIIFTRGKALVAQKLQKKTTKLVGK